MLNIPDHVPKDLVQQLEECQTQLKILLGNYKILQQRHKINPDDEVNLEHFKQVQKYIIQFNDKQAPIIKKIREIIKEGSGNTSKSSDEEKHAEEDQEGEEEKPISEDEILESLGLKNVARTPSGKIDHAKLSMKDRMAIVRGMRKRRRKYNGTVANTTNGGAPKKRSPSPSNPKEESSPTVEEQPTEEDEFLVPEGQYKGHVTEMEKLVQSALLEKTRDCYAESSELAKLRNDVVLQDCDKPQFLTHLNLFTQNEVDSLLALIHEDGRKKIEFRNLTYIPEMTDRKLKVNYNYLAPDISSPPLLRTRQRRHPANSTAASSRFNSRSNSRATTPEKITRQASSESNVADSLISAEERAALEAELKELNSRLDEVQAILAANKRTVSTRKERSRLSEVSEEAVQLEARIDEIKKIIA